MNKFKKILVVIDPESEFEPAVLYRAAGLARANSASLSVIVIVQRLPVEDLPLGIRTLARFHYPNNFRDAIEKRYRYRVGQQIAGLETDIAVDFTLKWSRRPFVTIIQHVLSHGHDLLIKELSRVAGLGAVLLSPTDRHLMRKCPSTIWAMKPGHPAGYRRVLAAVDSFPVDESNNELNQRILQLADSISANVDADLHIANAYCAGPATSIFGFNLHEYQQDLATVHRDHLDALLKTCSICPSATHLLYGVPGKVIPEFAEHEGIDAIVMATISRGGIPGLLIGNTAERILDRVTCDVVVVKPKGFITPVSLADYDSENSFGNIE